MNSNNFLTPGTPTNMRSNLYDSLRLGGPNGNMTSVMESLQSQLKQKDGEISQLQVIV